MKPPFLSTKSQIGKQSFVFFFKSPMFLRPDEAKRVANLVFGRKTLIHLIDSVEIDDHRPQNTGDRSDKTCKRGSESDRRNCCHKNSAWMLHGVLRVSPLREFAGGDFFVEFGGSVLGDAQRLPLVATEMAREKNNLPDVVGVVRDLAVDGLRHGMRLGANRYGPGQVRVSQWLKRIEEILPAAFPEFQQFSTRLRRGFKFRVAISVGLLSIGGQEICPTRFHVPHHVFDDGGDGIRFGVEHSEQARIRALRDGAVSQLLVVAE